MLIIQPKVWPDYGKNKESPADLWLGLLSFYTEQFSFKEYVISIRQKTPLTKFERLWNTSTIAIEGTTDLHDNYTVRLLASEPSV